MDIIVRKVFPEVNGHVLTYHIKNIETVTVDANMPVTLFSMPQQGDEQAIAIKIQGNETVINISWTIKPTEATSLVDEVVDATKYPSGIKTDQDNLKFLTTEFATTKVEDVYHIYLGDTDYNGGSSPPLTKTQADAAWNASTVFKKKGLLRKVSFTRSGGSPATYTANLEFQVGTVVVVDELNIVT